MYTVYSFITFGFHLGNPWGLMNDGQPSEMAGSTAIQDPIFFFVNIDHRPYHQTFKQSIKHIKLKQSSHMPIIFGFVPIINCWLYPHCCWLYPHYRAQTSRGLHRQGAAPLGQCHLASIPCGTGDVGD